ncbi:hypothetical protein F8388_015316 [Cannabis sativa]|uniref:Uncharacterized protein n=1 Tax=Cannabis sativa TaxID=3483 RepID=A0A7J6F1W5_CANSA|nr:hypothetical protein F8388_015316 [Cannabis sativa]
MIQTRFFPKWLLPRNPSKPTSSFSSKSHYNQPIISPSPIVNPILLQPRVVVYDGVCHLCHQGVKWVIKLDKHRKIKFCCLQSEIVEPYLSLCGLNRDDVLRRFLFVEGHGSNAALRVVSYLPFPYSTLSGFRIFPTTIRDSVYDYVAKRRYEWFGKENDCLLLGEKEMLERFIDRDEILDNYDCSVDEDLISSFRKLSMDSICNQNNLIFLCSLARKQQMRVFATTPAEYCKVILATNITKTSVTIPGIKYVIDPGLVKARSVVRQCNVIIRSIRPCKKCIAIYSLRDRARKPGSNNSPIPWEGNSRIGGYRHRPNKALLICLRD